VSQLFKVRVFDKVNDYQSVIRLISDVIINEFKFKLEFDSLDSDLLQIENTIMKLMEEVFGLLKGILGTIRTTVILK
jgi:hypothetical protein